MTAPLQGVRVVELASELGAFAGKLLAGLGAEVIVVEPPGGHRTRAYGPFVAGHEGDPEHSLWWWHYATSKHSVVLDLDTPAGADAFRRLAATADIVLEGQPPGDLAARSLDHADVRDALPRLVWVSVTPFGRRSPRANEPATDLTILAGAGPVWSCGYDDHTLPPVRGGGNQAMHTAGVHAACAALIALLQRDVSGRGQHIDVSAYAASNVTTEAATYEYLVAGATVQRQTGRHAAPNPSMPAQVLAADGIWITTGVPPRQAGEFAAVARWLHDLGLDEEFDELFFLEMGVERGGVHLVELGVDPEATAIFGAGRNALTLLATRLPAAEFFEGAQRNGIAVGVINSIEDVLGNHHLQARGFPVEIHHHDLGRDVAYLGAPFRMTGSPWQPPTRAPHVGEHQHLQPNG